MRRKKSSLKKKPDKDEASKDKEKKKEQSICFEYEKPKHFKIDCSQLKKSMKYKKKV